MRNVGALCEHAPVLVVLHRNASSNAVTTPAVPTTRRATAVTRFAAPTTVPMPIWASPRRRESGGGKRPLEACRGGAQTYDDAKISGRVVINACQEAEG